MSQGIIYYNKGFKCIPRLIICIQSLRKHYNGNVTLFQDGEHDIELIKNLQKTFGVDIIYDINPDTVTLVRKIEVSKKSPYDYTALIDADMLIVGKVDELIEASKKYEFVATNFAEWKSNGGTIRGRILRFKESYPQYMDAAINFGPAINTGAYSFPKDSPFFKEWIEIAKVGQKMNTWIPDEVACQILLPRYKTHVLPTKFNVSVNYDPNTQDKRIIHFHGKKHVIQRPLCKLWIDAFYQACMENVCNIRKFADPKYGDRRLKKFLSGRYGWEEEIKKIKPILLQEKEIPKIITRESIPNNYKLKDNPQDITIVTACDPKYIAHLEITYPNWIKYKNINKFSMIVYINGFKNGIKSQELNFLRNNSNIKIIEWDFPLAKSQRERMLSAFVYGTARDVKTKYWIKIDADAFCLNSNDLIEEEMKDYDIYGHKWGYTKPYHWIEDLDIWANKLSIFKNTKTIFNPQNVNGRRYCHQRIASYIQFHKTDFVKKAAEIAGERLPVPSHDTYLWYIAERLGFKWKRHNFKRFTGFSNTPHIEKLKMEIQKVDIENGRK
jgi:hypothetical protein